MGDSFRESDEDLADVVEDAPGLTRGARIDAVELPYDEDGVHAWRFNPRFLRDPGPGPWDAEPDKLQWIDEDSGYDCLIVRAVHHGALCGYVGLPPGHPVYDLERAAIRGRYGWLTVHGGISFADHCQPGEPGAGVCHRPEYGATDDPWWVGFSCGTFTDHFPVLFRGVDFAAWPTQARPVYRDVEYVEEQVESLAYQLAWIARDEALTWVR